MAEQRVEQVLSRVDYLERQLEREVGHIRLDDPSLAYVRQLSGPRFGPGIVCDWRFRVYLPAGQRYRLVMHVRTGQRSAWTYHRISESAEGEQFTLVARLTPNLLNEPKSWTAYSSIDGKGWVQSYIDDRRLCRNLEFLWPCQMHRERQSHVLSIQRTRS